MKKGRKSTFFIVALLIFAFAYTTIYGISYYFADRDDVYLKGLNDIRLGIDIQGGVDATFSPADGVDATDAQMDSILETIKMRLASQNILDSETYVDYDKDSVIVRFPWQAGESDFDPQAAVDELGQTAMLFFIEGDQTTSQQYYQNYALGVSTEGIILTGDQVASATAGSNRDEQGNLTNVVNLKFNDTGKRAFGDATSRLYASGGSISIWMDTVCISSPTVQAPLTDGEAVITGNFTAESAKKLADQINSGALPFALEVTSFKTISPTLGMGALDAMILASVISFALISIYMMFSYRLQGFVAAIGLLGQVAGILAFVSGYFGFNPSSTLTLPGIAGIILSIGMGVDANVITGERIKEELQSGKSLESALKAGYKRAFSSIWDGNITGIIVAITLMGAFGVPDSIFSRALSPIFRWFGVSTEGTIYSFGFTLLTGTILNLVMGVWACRLMVMSLSKFKSFRNKALYGRGIVNKESSKESSDSAKAVKA